MDENTNPPSVSDKSILNGINPIDHPEVYTRLEARWYRFDYTSSVAADGDRVITSPFMEGRWISA